MSSGMASRRQVDTQHFKITPQEDCAALLSSRHRPQAPAGPHLRRSPRLELLDVGQQGVVVGDARVCTRQAAGSGGQAGKVCDVLAAATATQGLATPAGTELDNTTPTAAHRQSCRR